MNLSKKIPTPVAFTIILLLVFLLTGIEFWQYSKLEQDLRFEFPVIKNYVE